MERIEKDFVYYDPVAGMTILEAIMKAIKLAKEHIKTVKTNLNDVDMVITTETKPAEALTVFHKRLDALHAQQIQKTKE